MVGLGLGLALGFGLGFGFGFGLGSRTSRRHGDVEGARARVMVVQDRVVVQAPV